MKKRKEKKEKRIKPNQFLGTCGDDDELVGNYRTVVGENGEERDSFYTN